MSDLSRMWFRLTGSGGSSTTEEGDDLPQQEPLGHTINLNSETNNNNNNNNETFSKFDKFRRGSFRRKSSSMGQSSKRSKSPHFIIKHQPSTSLEEADEMEEKEIIQKTDKPPNVALNVKTNKVKTTKEKSKQNAKDKTTKKVKEKEKEKEEIVSVIPHSDSLTKCNNKKTSLKSLKNADTQKKKFYKNFYNTKTASQDSQDETIDKTQLTHIFPNNSTGITVSALAEDDDDDDDDDDNEEVVEEAEDEDSEDSESDTEDDSDSSEEDNKQDSAISTTPDNLPRLGKEKIFLNDRKFRNNRIEKSSSKTKIAGDLDKRESIKRSRSSRKIPTASAIMAAAEEKNKLQQQQKKLKTEAKDSKKQNRGHSNLNLQALVKFVMNNKKFLNTDDFNLIRRKSISEAASAVIQVAATCKPMPIALKYSQDGVVADAPKENDVKGERNVVLVKKQSLNNSFYDRLLNNPTLNVDSLKPPVKERKMSSAKSSPTSTSSMTSKTSSAKVKRNSSNSSKSSGNFEDEAFYSCDERDEDELDCAQESHIQQPIKIVEPKRKSSSPSLTSRVAAKINETTNNYKNRKAASKNAKKRKTLAASAVAGVECNEGPEYYKQLNVERLNSTSIQRHPSDRRTDSANLSIRSNGNTSANLNNSDLHSSFHGADTSVGALGGGAQGGNAATISCSDATNSTIGALSTVAQQNVGAVSPGGSGVLGTLNDINAQDANEGNLRRERLHQQHQQNKSAPVSVNRSESYKERLSHKRNRSQRKTSDPNLTSRPNDDQPDLGLSNSNFTASSNSSLSSGGGSESPSTSMEQMGGAGVATPTATTSAMHHHHHHHQHQHSHQDSFHGSIGGSSNASFLGGSAAGGQMARHWNFESDEEDDLNEADWSSNVAGEILAALTDAEKKRQEIINEIYQTERSHVRTLKLLKHLFLLPLQESNLLSQDHLLLLFPPSLSSLCDLHGAFEQKLKQRRLDHNYIVNSVGDLFAEMFDGKNGEELREFAAQFCARQQIALEALKEKRRKDEQLQKLLSKAESHKACRRLQLKDLLPTVLQRLTKYPLLFENLYKVTVRVVPEDTAEAEAIQKALESSKKILVDVNQAVKTAEDAHKLQNIQRKLDKSTFDKDEFKNLDLTQYRLIHDGSLTMKKNPSIQLHGLLFETMIVLLTKQDDKYSLKYLHAARNTEVNNKPVSPIMSIDSETLVRQEAADKNSFFLIKTKTSQMLELRAPSSSECKTWFKHISDAAEQYKPRSKNANQEPVDDPAIATLPHSNTRESLELTPERPPPQSATATLITTPLAPMMPIPSVSQERSGFAQTNNNDVQLRNGRRESTPTSSSAPADAYPPYYNIKQRLSHNELSPNTNAVNRTMSTRSCGDANHNYSNTSPEFAGANGVTLRHTQSARQANGSTEEAAAAALAAAGVANKRDSASIVYSNNSNNTRTLMQSSPPLVEPTAIQISISPAHTAEPVLTPAEKLRRLDASIRDGLMEKQKIICDMFRLPVEHFHEIVDIATMPEAPKDSTDIALAAYAQVQSLTEVINDYMKVTPEQEVSAVSTAVCDKCHEKRENQPHSRTRSNVACGKAETKASTSTSSDIPPPLPPPNKQMAQAQQQTPAPTVTKMQTCALEDANIHEDDDGYCEIDELRLPALPPLTKTPTTATATPPPLPPAVKASGAKQGSPPPPLPPPAGTFKTPPPPPPPPAKTLNQNSSIPAAATVTNSASNNTNTTPELVKRQSTISADSIPEESADEVTHALNDHLHSKVEAHKSPEIKEDEEENEPENESATKEENEKTLEEPKTTATSAATEVEEESEDMKIEPIAPIATIEDEDDKDEDSAMHTAECESAPLEENVVKEESSKKEDNDTKDIKDDAVNPKVTTTSMTAEPQRQNSNATQADEEISLNSEHIEINEAYECLSNINKLNTALSSMVDNSTQTLPLTTSLPVSTSTTIISTSNNITSSNSSTNPNGHLPTLCGPNRIQHANSLEPSVPCHALSNIVSVLNNQISLLLPKINERDMERERLRKENQHLRELLNAMHERQRVEAKLETPSDITARAEVADDETDGFSPATSTTPTPTPTPTTANSAAALGEDQKDSDNSTNNTTTTTSSSATTNTVEAQN
ncbi:uncharacterized protein LOC111680389 isoform X2 [Lucilia cuprina]|uniref:uncharacterized protein LOC111680389 isoform X2 n=1 Tax=Lucilia cuprina TaxID=7375 RepID=UPI001F059283|nr:uncharacterized protein LOC111680389 isoform X2 [Lucilia cuprina]